MDNFRLSAYGAALKRLGTVLTNSSALATNDSTFYGGIYWPSRDQIFAIGGNTSSSALTLYETSYPTPMPATWTTIGGLNQYRPVIFTDDTWPEVMYLAGDNTKLVQKAAPLFNTVTVDSRNTGATTGAATSVTWSHVVGAGSNRALLVFLSTQSAVATSSVKWDVAGANLSFTLLTSLTTPVSTGRLELWYLVGPANATKVITVTMASSTSINAASASYTNVNQTTPFTVTSPRTSTGLAGTQPSTMLPTGADQMTVDCVLEQSGASLSPAAAQTSIVSEAHLAASDAPSAGTMSWTSAAADWAQIAASLNPTINGTGLKISTLPSTTASVSGLVVYNDRLWGWNTSGQSNALFYSNLESAVPSIGGDSLGDAANGGGEIIVNTFGLSGIVACTVVGSSLLIFHQRGISRLTGFGQDTITVKPQALSADVGMSNGTPDGICVFANVAYFASDRGIYAASEASVQPLGNPDKPDPTLALLTAGSTDPSKFLLRFNRQYNELWVTIKGTGIYIYNVILGAWSGPFTGTYANGTVALFEVINSATGLAHLWRTSFASSAMNVSECDRASVFTDDATGSGTGGTAVTATLRLHRMFAGDRTYAKTFRWLNILANIPLSATSPTVACMTPVAGTTTLTMATATGFETPYYLSPGGQGVYLDATITDAVTNGLTQYASATVQGNLLGQR